MAPRNAALLLLLLLLSLSAGLLLLLWWRRRAPPPCRSNVLEPAAAVAVEVEVECGSILGEIEALISIPFRPWFIAYDPPDHSAMSRSTTRRRSLLPAARPCLARRRIAWKCVWLGG